MWQGRDNDIPNDLMHNQETWKERKVEKVYLNVRILNWDNTNSQKLLNEHK